MVFFIPDYSNSTGIAGPPGPVGTGDYGSIFSHGIAIAQALPAAFVKLAGLFTTNGLAAGGGVTPDAASDRLVINTTGVYMLWFMVHPTAAVGGVLSVQARQNGLSLPDVAGQHTLSSSPIWGAARGKGSVALTAGDVIELYGFSNTGSAVTYSDAQLMARRLA